MIIYGSKATQIAAEGINDKCPNCETQGSIQMVVFQIYGHIFWIPFFPVRKTGATQCLHCKQILRNNEFPINLRNHYETLKSNSKAPIWTFSGLALLSLLIIWIVINGKLGDQRNAQLVSKPQKEDVYEVKNKDSQYTLYKVDRVAGDTVFVLMSLYETNKITGLIDLKNKGNEAFTKESLPILKTELKNMLDKGEIMDVDRK